MGFISLKSAKDGKTGTSLRRFRPLRSLEFGKLENRRYFNK